MSQSDWRNKVAGFKRLFEKKNGQPVGFDLEGSTLKVKLALYDRRRDRHEEGGDSRFWYDDAPATLLAEALSSHLR